MQLVSAELQTRFMDWNVQFGTEASMETVSRASSSVGAARAVAERRAVRAASVNFILKDCWVVVRGLSGNNVGGKKRVCLVADY